MFSEKLSTFAAQASYWDNVCSIRDIMAWVVESPSDLSAAADGLEQVSIEIIKALRKESSTHSVTLFVSDDPGRFVALGLARSDYEVLKLRFTSLLSGEPTTRAGYWRLVSSPDEALTEPRFRYTPTILKDYGWEDEEQIGTLSNKDGLDMVFFGAHCERVDADVYSD